MLRIRPPIRPMEDRTTTGDVANRTVTATNDPSRPSLVACFILAPKQADTLISILQEFLSNADGIDPENLPTFAIMPTEGSASIWLTHPDAAKYLGISTSTLYRYAEQGRIESRKIGNRLEYRRSALDQFKVQHVRAPRIPRQQEV